MIRVCSLAQRTAKNVQLANILLNLPTFYPIAAFKKSLDSPLFQTVLGNCLGNDLLAEDKKYIRGLTKQSKDMNLSQ